MKLNLGCGTNFIDGFLNVDKYTPVHLKDASREALKLAGFKRFDLEACFDEPPEYIDDAQPHLGRGGWWPWRDNTVSEVNFIHSLEHMGQTPTNFRHIIQELYRICEHNAVIRIHVPHPRHDDFMNDPTHVRPITPDILNLFSKRLNLEWREKRLSNSQLALAWDVNFEVESCNGVLDPAVEEQGLPQEQVRDLVRGLNNVCKELHITLRAIKEMVH